MFNNTSEVAKVKQQVVLISTKKTDSNDCLFSFSKFVAFLITLFFVFTFLGTFNSALAETPSTNVQDAQSQELPAVWKNKISKLAKNISKSRQSLTDNRESIFNDPFKTKQFANKLENYRSSLSKVPASNDPLLITTTKDLLTLEKEFAEANSGKGKAVTTQTTSPKTAVTKSTTPQSTTPESTAPPKGKQLVSGQKVQVNKLIRDMKNVHNSIKTEGPSDLQSASVVNKYKAAVDKYTTALKRYKEYTGSPLVIEALQTYKALRSRLSTEFKRAQSQLAKLGNPAKLMAAVDAKQQGINAPKWLPAPFSQEDIQAWVKQIKEIKKTAADVTAEVQRISAATNLDLTGGKYGVQRANSMLHWANKAVRDSDAALSETEMQLNHQFQFQNKHELPYFRKLNPDNEKDRANAFLQEGSEGRIFERLDKQLAMAESFAAFEQATKGKISAEKQARVDEVIALRKKYSEDRIKAVGISKLPKPASNDVKMLAIAKDIIEKPDYEMGQHGPIVLTTKEIVTREQEVSRDTIKDVDISLSGKLTWSGTRETWQYKWQEFKFATPIKDKSGDWYIWWITAKNYSSGASTTPLNEWVSGRTTKGSLILEENFNK
ncbi:hypothetical protein [uncultured Cocleimonas sp.]|uniref:hypothetical protein n=1 Tax=uncultured Cocleimonas sp. TaxID=1051587 RepID=UPI00260D1DDB|nr:hypothetical protein [uncultured Cocleimonas sp.]